MTEKNFNDNSIVVSISCITYNHAPYIRQCLDGFMMQQTNFAFEVLIHDDASTDGTTDIIKEYEAKYPDIIKPIYEEENQWVKGRRGSAVFNFPRAKGKYIALCEGDDYWTDPLKLQKQVDFLKKNPAYSMCFHGARVDSFIEKDKCLSCENIEERDYSANELFVCWTVPTASIVFNAECVNYPLVKEDLFLNGDIRIILVASKVGLIRGMSSIMSVYRMHMGGVSYNPLIQEDRCKKYPNHFKAIKANFDNIDTNVINERLARSYINRAKIHRNLCFRIFDYFRAICYFPKKELLKSIFRVSMNYLSNMTKN